MDRAIFVQDSAPQRQITRLTIRQEELAPVCVSSQPEDPGCSGQREQYRGGLRNGGRKPDVIQSPRGRRDGVEGQLHTVKRYGTLNPCEASGEGRIRKPIVS